MLRRPCNKWEVGTAAVLNLFALRMSSLPLHQRRDPLFPAYPLFVVVLSRKRSLSQRVALEEIHAHFKTRWYLFHGSFKFKKDKKKKRRERDVPGRLWLFKSTRSAAGQAHKYIYIIRAHTNNSPGLWRWLHTTVNHLSPSLSLFLPSTVPTTPVFLWLQAKSADVPLLRPIYWLTEQKRWRTARAHVPTSTTPRISIYLQSP